MTRDRKRMAEAAEGGIRASSSTGSSTNRLLVHDVWIHILTSRAHGYVSAGMPGNGHGMTYTEQRPTLLHTARAVPDGSAARPTASIPYNVCVWTRRRSGKESTCSVGVAYIPTMKHEVRKPGVGALQLGGGD